MNEGPERYAPGLQTSAHIIVLAPRQRLQNLLLVLHLAPALRATKVEYLQLPATHIQINVFQTMFN